MVLHNPREANGVIRDAAGNLYGTTLLGGGIKTGNCGISSPGCGTAFELSPGVDGRSTETILHSFGRGADGQEPLGRRQNAPSPRAARRQAAFSDRAISFAASHSCASTMRLPFAHHGSLSSTLKLIPLSILRNR